MLLKAGTLHYTDIYNYSSVRKFSETGTVNAQWPINRNFNKTTHAENNLAGLIKICQYLALYLAGEKS